MSNNTHLPVSLSLNERFLPSFMDEEAPCTVLGLGEEAYQAKAFVAARINESLPTQASRSGFDFGYGLLG